MKIIWQEAISRKKKSPYETPQVIAILEFSRLRASAGRGKSFLVAQSKLNKRSAVPRHTEIVDILAKKICKDLGIPPIK